MCEICVAKAKIEMLESQLALRFQQHILELSTGDSIAASYCATKITTLVSEILVANAEFVKASKGVSPAVRH
jgi:hypothetical protein